MIRASSRSWSATDSCGSSDTGGAAVVDCQVAPSFPDTSTVDAQAAAWLRELMGHVPTTAHTLDPMALTSDTTGPTGACTQDCPPSDVTYKGTVPWADGVPPHRYP